MNKYSKIFATLSMGAILLAGCAQTPVNEVVSLKVWGDDLDQALLQQLVEEFKAANPTKTYQITFGVVGEGEAKTNVLADIEAAADVFAFADDQILDLVKAGALYEITFNKAQVTAANVAGSIDISTVDGKLYAYPFTADNGYFLYYDKRVVTADQVKTLDGLLAAANAKNAKFAYDISNSWYLAGLFLGAGGKIDINANLKNVPDFNNARGVQLVEEVIWPLVNNTAFLNTSSEAVMADLFSRQQLAAGVIGTWGKSAIQGALGENMGVTKLPTMTLGGQQVQMGSFAGYKLMGVKRTTKFPLEAQRLADFITNEQSQLRRYEVRSLGPSNINAGKNSIIQSDIVLAALALQNNYATPMKNLTTYWGPAGSFGETLVSKELGGNTFKQLLDKMVGDMLA
jgi:arabinogalactan oligomer / maltooligosaccharide transport system substrate-binding protein